MTRCGPLMAIMSRKFVAYEGWHVTLECGHVTVRPQVGRQRSMRCEQCLENTLNALREIGVLS